MSYVKKIDIYAVVRKNIKKYRIDKNMTQADLTEKADLTHDYIRQIESNKVANTFSVQTLYDISVALDVEIGTLFEVIMDDKKTTTLFFCKP